jgi:hypothetical protein
LRGNHQERAVAAAPGRRCRTCKLGFPRFPPWSRHPHIRIERPTAAFYLSLARVGRWPGCTRFAQPEWCPEREARGGRGASRCVAVQVPERACGAAGSRQSAGHFTLVKRSCALIRDRRQSPGAGAPRPPPSRCRTSELAPHLVTVHADPLSRVVRRTAPSARTIARVDRSAGCTLFAQLPDQCRERSSIQMCVSREDVLPCLICPGGSRTALSPGLTDHIGLRRCLPLKVPPAASRLLPLSLK